MSTAVATEDKKDTRIACQICRARIHSVQQHLLEDHPELTLAEYSAKWPDAPLMSDILKKKLEERAALKAKTEAPEAAELTGMAKVKIVKRAMSEVFGLGDTPAAKSAAGKEIMVTTFDRDALDPYDLAMVPEIDPNYVFNIDMLRSVILALEWNIPMYLWGHSGTGKTTLLEQVFARTGRPTVRIQHTRSTEESHILGKTGLKGGVTAFEPGYLQISMERGWAYLADEYDFAQPEVLAVYQPVLEGKALVIKEADLDKRVTHPHPDFRMFATGNTNGTGDESGLYAGTVQQNAANYERFGITEKMPYLPEAAESRLVSLQGRIPVKDATKLVQFANVVRNEFESGKLSRPISPRTLIYAAKVGAARMSYRIGVEKAYINQLTSVDREVAGQLAQRMFA